MRANGFTRTNNGTTYAFTGWNTKADGSGAAYTAGASYSFTSNVTLYAQWKQVSYTLKWTSELATTGSYLGTGSVTSGSSSKAGGKRIVYTNTSGNTAYADPYSAGSIEVKSGTPVMLQMVAGNGSAWSYVHWYVGGSEVGRHDATSYLLLLSSWTPSGSATLYGKDGDLGYVGGGYGYYWYVSVS